MNFLIQAYAAEPNRGGEFGISWGWITNLDNRVLDDDKIYVVSLTLNEQHIKKNGLKHVELISLEEKMKPFSFLIHTPLYYIIWQNIAFNTVKKKKIKLDYIHMYSLSDFRNPGKWYKIKDCCSILGPVGGGQVCPKSLIEYDNIEGKIRQIVNNWFKYSLVYKYKVSHYTKAYVCNYETQKYISKSELLPDVPLSDRFRNLSICKPNNEIIKIIFCGRLINKKGVMLLLDVIKRMMNKNSNKKFHLSIYGDGKQLNEIERVIKTYNLSNAITIEGAVPYDRMSDVYRRADIFVLPSLRESGGNVLVEAMAHKLPIVSLDMAFSTIIKEYNVGLFIKIDQDKDKIIDEFADKLISLIDNQKLRDTLGQNGYDYVNLNLNWDVIMNKVYQM